MLGRRLIESVTSFSSCLGIFENLIKKTLDPIKHKVQFFGFFFFFNLSSHKTRSGANSSIIYKI